MVTVKRFWLFGFYRYDREGGMSDFIGSFDDVDDAMKSIHSDSTIDPFEMGHIFCTLENRIVKTFSISDRVNRDGSPAISKGWTDE